MLIEPLRTSPHFESDDGRVWCDRAVGEDHARVSARAVAWFRGGDRKSCVSIVAAARRHVAPGGVVFIPGAKGGGPTHFRLVDPPSKGWGTDGLLAQLPHDYV